MLQEKALQEVAEQLCHELVKMLPLLSSLAGPRSSKEQYWIQVFRFMDQVMPGDTADCSLDQLTEDASTVLTYIDQV